MMTTAQRLKARLASTVFVKPAIRLDDAPICTFSFDDCPKSALKHAGAALEAAGAGGTFLISSMAAMGLAETPHPLMWGDDLVRARAAGHEIGCHTYSHPHLPGLSRPEIDREIDENLGAIRSVVPDIELTSFAYPYGEVSLLAKRRVAARFAIARGVRPGLNGRIVDLAELRGYALRSRDFDRDRIAHTVREAIRRRSWLVFTTHDVTAQPTPWGCTPAEFDIVLDTVRRAGLPILTLKAGLGRVSHRIPRD